MHDCSEQINFQSHWLRKRDFIYMCWDIIPDVATVTASESAVWKRQRVQSWLVVHVVACVCACLVPFIYQWVHSLFFFCLSIADSPPSVTSSWTSASGIWSRLWPCSVPGSRTLTAKALLSTDELSEHTPSPTSLIPARLCPLPNAHSRPPGALFLFSSDINQGPLEKNEGRSRKNANSRKGRTGTMLPVNGFCVILACKRIAAVSQKHSRYLQNS